MSSARVPLTIGRALRSAARKPDKLAIVQGERKLTYGALIRRMDQVSHLAASHYKLERGDRALLVAPNTPEYLELVAGLAEAGVIVALVNPALSAAEIAQVMEDCAPRLIIVHPSVAFEPPPGTALLRLDARYEDLLGRAAPSPFHSVADEDDPFALAYTSGTTGEPKGVLLSHRSRSLTFMAMAAEYGCFGPDDHFLAIAPMCHGAGFAFATAPLAFGGQVTLFNGGDPELLLTRLVQGDITGVFVVPTHLDRLARLPDTTLDGHREHGLKAIISNAAALPQRLKEFALGQFGERLLHETYGSTEAGIVTNIRPADLMRKPGSVGLPFANMQVELRTESGALTGPGEVGELFSRGPTSFSGYWQRPAETAETIRGGWVTVGDLASADEEGFITILDRKKDMIVSGGINVYPREVEAVIAQIAGVSEVAVIGLPDSEWGERVHAVVVGADLVEARIVAHCRERLAGYKCPRSVTFIDALPRNAAGKLLKRKLREDSITHTP
jgi:long-chain acyl-CoA synthetase